MPFPNPFQQFDRNLSQDISAQVRRGLYINIACAGVIGFLIFFACAMIICGTLDLHLFTFVILFLFAAQVIICWVMSQKYDLLEKISILNSRFSTFYAAIGSEQISSTTPSVPVEPPRFES
ncbi:MAG: hypothetical protein ACXU8A_06415 [Burkholderiaceae bacterium]